MPAGDLVQVAPLGHAVALDHFPAVGAARDFDGDRLEILGHAGHGHVRQRDGGHHPAGAADLLQREGPHQVRAVGIDAAVRVQPRRRGGGRHAREAEHVGEQRLEPTRVRALEHMGLLVDQQVAPAGRRRERSRRRRLAMHLHVRVDGGLRQHDVRSARVRHAAFGTIVELDERPRRARIQRRAGGEQRLHAFDDAADGAALLVGEGQHRGGVIVAHRDAGVGERHAGQWRAHAGPDLQQAHARVVAVARRAGERAGAGVPAQEVDARRRSPGRALDEAPDHLRAGVREVQRAGRRGRGRQSQHAASREMAIVHL